MYINLFINYLNLAYRLYLFLYSFQLQREKSFSNLNRVKNELKSTVKNSA